MHKSQVDILVQVREQMAKKSREYNMLLITD